MVQGDALDVAAGALHDPALALPPDEKHRGSAADHATELPPVYEGKPTDTAVYAQDSGELPTEEELHTLRRVADPIPWKAYTIAFVELVERFSYYGTTVVCMSIPFGPIKLVLIPDSSHKFRPAAPSSRLHDRSGLP